MTSSIKVEKYLYSCLGAKTLLPALFSWITPDAWSIASEPKLNSVHKALYVKNLLLATLYTIYLNTSWKKIKWLPSTYICINSNLHSVSSSQMPACAVNHTHVHTRTHTHTQQWSSSQPFVLFTGSVFRLCGLLQHPLCTYPVQHETAEIQSKPVITEESLMSRRGWAWVRQKKKKSPMRC